MSAPVPISDADAGPPSAWPRRASRACASCRRDKIRCDGAKPCGACAKKGYAADQCSEGCEPCRRARVRCESDGGGPNGKPCRRCTEMKVKCHDGSPLVHVHVQTPAQIPIMIVGSNVNGPNVKGGAAAVGFTSSAPVGHYEDGYTAAAGSTVSGTSKFPTSNGHGRGPRNDRAKLACVGCRRDNKKCDDHRPCSRCVARAEECIHVNRGPKLVKLRCEGCREDNKRCEESRPCKYCLETQRECVIVPRKGRGHGTRVKAACVSCRRDKIRCNGERPCASCVKKGCECIERACTACLRDGRTSGCPHRSPPERAMLPISPTGVDSRAEVSDGTPSPNREKEYRFVPSQDDSRWITYASTNDQSSPITPSNAATYSSASDPRQQQQPGAGTGATSGYYYYSAYSAHNESNLQPSQYAGSQNTPGYSTSAPPSSNPYFFDVLDPSLGNFQVSQNMTSTSSSRTFLPDD